MSDVWQKLTPPLRVPMRITASDPSGCRIAGAEEEVAGPHLQALPVLADALLARTESQGFPDKWLP